MHGESFSAASHLSELNASNRLPPPSYVAGGGRTKASSALRRVFAFLNTLSRRLLPVREPRRLRLCETLSLGNRGYVAVVRYHEQQFLVGGTSSSIALLARLEKPAGAENESVARE